MRSRTKERAFRDLRKNAIAQFKRYMLPNENVIACFETEREDLGIFRSYDDTQDYYAQVLTENQLLAYRQHISNRDESRAIEHLDSMQLVDMDYVSESKFGESNFGVSAASKTVPKAINCGFASQASAQKFSDMLRRAMASTKANAAKHSLSPTISSSPPLPTKTIQERLKDLFELRKAGLINDAEFEQTRKRILDEM